MIYALWVIYKYTIAVSTFEAAVFSISNKESVNI